MYQQTFSPPPVMPGMASPPPNNYRPPPPMGRSPMSPGANMGYQTPNGGYQNMPYRPNRNGHAASPNPPLPIPPPQPKHKGTLAPGTLIKVADVTVRIEKYLSEGGYAHVYLTSSDGPIYPPRKGEQPKGRWGEKGYTQHCLKRIAFEDEKVWVDVRKEIEVMKALPPNPHLTQFLASAHARLPNGGYEVYILMEFCSGGGIIDLLNKRLRDRLKEIEILNIFTDVCEAVAAMHALKQPLLHRDLKIENVLSAPSSTPPTAQRPTTLTFKLCDFGSTTFPSDRPPSNKIEADSLAMDLNKHTTLQYRSPEMVEPMLGWAVGLPSDVWALGVLLYKLCYYTTPFEEHGTLAIVNARYTFPQYPVYSPQIQHLIASMLVDHPARRPTVFEVLRTACDMSGTRPEIDYPTPSRSFPHPAPPPKQQSTNLLDFTSPSPSSAPAPAQDLASTVQPGRRGRPTREPSQQSVPSVMPLPRPPIVQTPTPQAPVREQTGKSGTDAFGMPTLQSQRTPVMPGRADAFGMGGLQAQLPSREATGKSDQDAFGMSSSFKEPSLDAFGAPKAGTATNAKLFDRLVPSRPTPSFTDSFTGKFPSGDTATPMLTGVPQTTSPEPRSASSPKTEATFETRFPSIEMLDAEDRQQSAHDLISPIKSPETIKPPLQAKASMMGHLTGDHAATHLSAVRADKMPTARSTQVTGTAFKDANAMSRAAQLTGDAPDLMTGDGYQELTSKAEREETPRPDVQVVTEKVEAGSSSDEEAEPESATARYPKRQASSLAARRAAFEKPAHTPPPVRDASPTKRTFMIAAQFEKPDGRPRPMSMYGSSPRAEEPLSAVSAPAAVEQASTPGPPTDPVPEPETAKSLAPSAPKPTPKPKPAIARKPTLDKPAIAEKPTTSDAPRVRPEIKPKPSRHGDMPVVQGYSRSSSGRAFPISRPTEVVNAEKPKSPEKKPIDLTSGSPDKRQSVNSLIARWNAQ